MMNLSRFWKRRLQPRMQIAVLLLLGAAAQPAAAQDGGPDIPPAHYPRLPASGADARAFVPAGWRIDRVAQGDVNGDGLPDIVFVLQQSNRAYVLEDNAASFDTNPRILAVAIGQGPGKPYRLAMQNHSLITRTTEARTEDAFDKDQGDLTVRRGAFTVTIGFFANMGSWDISRRSFIFRLQGGRCVLIGFDMNEGQRSNGSETVTSIDYLSGRMVVSHRDDPRDPLKRHTTIKSAPLLAIDAVGDGLLFDPSAPHRP